MTYIDELHDEMMKSPGYRAAHRASGPVYQLIEALIAARAQAGVTQAEIAERMGTTQSAVARLEGWTANPSVKTLRKYAEATGTRLVVSFEPIEAKMPDSDDELRESDSTSGPDTREPSGEPSVSIAV